MSNVSKALSRWKEVIIITAISRIFLFILSILILNPSNIFYPWVQWDGPHYIDIAKNWYQTSGEQALWIVFSPLYPLLIKIVNLLVSDFSVASILISVLFSFGASILLFELAILDFNRQVAVLSVWFLNIFPTAYFLQASYTESLFLTLSLATIYLFRKKLFVSSGIIGIFTSMTRLNGILLIPTLLMETKNIKKSIVVIVMLPTGTLVYLFINYLIFHDPLYFTKPLLSNWHQSFQYPWIGINNLVSSILSINNPAFYINFSEITFLLIMLSLVIYVFFKVRKSYSVYMLLNFLFCSSSGFIMSTPRHTLVLFPIFIALGALKNKVIISILSILSLALLLFYTNLYIQGGWAF